MLSFFFRFLHISVQSLSCVQIVAIPWIAACQTSLSITNSRSLLKLMSIMLVIPSNHLILCCPLLLLPSIFLSIRVFSKESVLLIGWSKYWSFSFSISPSKEYLGLISCRIDRFDLFAVQGTLKSLLQHCSSKASIHQCPAVIMWAVQLPHPYMTTGKSIALTIRTFFAKVATLLFNHCLGYGRPLQCSCLEDPRDGGARWAAVYGAHRVGHDWRDLAAAAGWS